MASDIRATLETMDKNTLIEMLLSMGNDRAFGVMNRNMAQTFHEDIGSGKTLIMIDICNMHAANHKYTMDGVDSRIKNVTDKIRHSDLVVRWGGDEIVIVLNSGNAAQYINRLDRIMQENDLYAVYATVTTSESLAESVNRADAMVMAKKLEIDTQGNTIDRNAPYVRYDSIVLA